jgi:HK97 family phage major capsid protein
VRTTADPVASRTVLIVNAWQTKAALGESSGVTGGYTVPPEFYQQLMTLIAENSFIRPRAFVLPMASATLQLPYLDVTTVQSAGVSPFFGGVQMYWTAEAQHGGGRHHS